MEEKKNTVLQIQSVKQGVKINNVLREIKKEEK